MKTEWKQIAEITVEPLRYVALKTDNGTFRMQVFHGDSLKSDRMYRGKYARNAMRDCLSGFPVRFTARRHGTSIDGFGECPSTYWTYMLEEELTPIQKLENERKTLISRLSAIAAELKELGYNKKPPKLTFDELCDCM